MGVMYKDKRVWTTKEINSVTRVNYASDFVYKKKELLEEGKDYFKLDKETYRALTNQTGVASGTILTESGIVIMANNTKNETLKSNLLKLLDENIIQPEPKEILKDNVNEESKLEPKRRKRKEKIVELTPIEKLIEETKEEISNNPDQETETNINKEEKRLIIDFPNIQCNINDMFEQYMKVQMMQIELWNQQLKNSNRMIEQLLNKNEELQESVKELLLFNAKETKTNIEDGIDFGSYMKEAYKLANKVLNLEGGKEKYSNKYGVLSNAYKLLNKEYGIVWAQIEKDFKKEYERTPISTLETSWYLEQKEPVHKNILFAKLSNMYEQDKAM